MYLALNLLYSCVDSCSSPSLRGELKQSNITSICWLVSDLPRLQFRLLLAGCSLFMLVSSSVLLLAIFFCCTTDYILLLYLLTDCCCGSVVVVVALMLLLLWYLLCWPHFPRLSAVVDCLLWCNVRNNKFLLHLGSIYRLFNIWRQFFDCIVCECIIFWRQLYVYSGSKLSDFLHFLADTFQLWSGIVTEPLGSLTYA